MYFKDKGALKFVFLSVLASDLQTCKGLSILVSLGLHHLSLLFSLSENHMQVQTFFYSNFHHRSLQLTFNNYYTEYTCTCNVHDDAVFLSVQLIGEQGKKTASGKIGEKCSKRKQKKACG